MSDQITERPITRVLAGVLGVPSIVLGGLVLAYAPSFWQAWTSTLVAGGLLTYAAWKGRLPGGVAPRASANARVDPSLRNESSVAWWKRAGIGLITGTLLGGLELLLSKPSWNDFAGIAVPFGVLTACLLVVAPYIRGSSLRLTAAGLASGAVAGSFSWWIAFREPGMYMWWWIIGGSIFGVAIAWIEAKSPV